MKLVLTRLCTQGNATIGILEVPGLKYPLWTLEDLWKNNQQSVSCIPAGEYRCKPHGWRGEPVKFMKVWEVCDVPGRSAILIHVGNTEMDTQGCILVGMGVSRGRVTESSEAIVTLRKIIGANGFDLQIIDRVARS